MPNENRVNTHTHTHTEQVPSKKELLIEDAPSKYGNNDEQQWAKHRHE
jgi:hypothetical protein